MTIREKIRHLSVKKQESILSASLILSITFALSALLGFLRSRILYSQFFSCCTAQLDAYNAAFRLPDLIFKLLVSGALSASFIPVFSNYLHKDRESAFKIASTVINALLVMFLFLSVTIFIFALPFSKIIAPGFTPDQLQLMANLTRILLFAQIFFLLSNFLTGIIQVHQLFFIPALSPIVYNIFIILSIYTLTPSLGIYGVAIGAVTGALFHLLIQYPLAVRLGFRPSTYVDIKHQGVREIVRLMLPRSLSLGLAEIENTITLFFASTLPAGSLSLLNLALQLMYLPSRIFGTTIGQASLPILSKNIARNEIKEFRTTVNRTILQSLFLAIPITALILVERLPIVRIVFGAKHFPWSATLITAQTLAYLTPAIICQAIIQILNRSFYAMHDTKTPLKISFVSLVVNVASSFYFIKFTNLEIIGLAISASLGNLTQCLGLFYYYYKRVDGHDWTAFFTKVAKITVASIVMSSFAWLLIRLFDNTVFDTTRTLPLMILFASTSLFGLLVYLLVAKLLHVEELSDFARLLRIKLL